MGIDADLAEFQQVISLIRAAASAAPTRSTFYACAFCAEAMDDCGALCAHVNEAHGRTIAPRDGLPLRNRTTEGGYRRADLCHDGEKIATQHVWLGKGGWLKQDRSD